MARTKRNSTTRNAICDRFVGAIEDGLHLNLSDASALLGYSTPSTIYLIKKHKCLPDIEKLVALSKLKSAKGARVNLDWLITGQGERFVPIGVNTEGVKGSRNIDIINTLSELPETKLSALQTLLGL